MNHLSEIIHLVQAKEIIREHMTELKTTFSNTIKPKVIIKMHSESNIYCILFLLFLVSACSDKKSGNDKTSPEINERNITSIISKRDDLSSADSLLKAGEYEEAFYLYNKELSVVTDSSQDGFSKYQAAVIGIGNVLIATRQLNEAIIFLDSIHINYQKVFKNDILFNSKLLYHIAFAKQALGQDSLVIEDGKKLAKYFKAANDSDYLNKTYWLIGISSQRVSDFSTALPYYLMSNKILEQYNGKDSAMLFKQYSTISGLYGNLSILDSALIYLNKTKEFSQILNQLKPQERLKYYYNAANFYVRINAYDEAMTNCAQAILNTSKELNAVNDAYPYNLMGQLYQEDGDFEKAIAYSARADSIFEMISDKEDAPQLTSSNYKTMCLTKMILSVCYHAQKQNDLAFSYGSKALQLGEAVIPNESSFLSEVSYNLCHLYYHAPNQNIDSVDYYIKKSLAYGKSGNKATLNRTVEINDLSLLAISYLSKENLKESKKICDSILADLQSILQDCNKNILKKLIYPEQYVEALDKTGDCYFKIYIQSGDFSCLQKAEKCCQYQLAITNYSIDNSDPLYANRFLNNLNSPIAKLLEINFEKGKLTKENLQEIAGVLENNKSVLLQQQNKERIISNVVYSEARQQLADERTHRIGLIERGAADLSADTPLKIEFIEVNKKIDSLNNIIYGQADDVKNGGSFSLDQFSIELSPSTAVLNFKLSDSSIFVLNVTNNSCNFNKVNLDSILNDKVKRFQEFLYHKQSGAEFVALSNELYKILITNNFSKDFIPENLVIIPDGQLNNIPFEALVSYYSKDSIRYLADDCNIRYEYCMDFILNKKKEENRSEGILALAPKFEKQKQKKSENLYAGITKNLFVDQPNLRTGVGPLQHNVEEVNEISSRYSVTELIDNDATEDAFRKNAKEYNMLHFATHAFSNADNPNLSGIILKLKNVDSVEGLNTSFQYSDSLLERDNILHAYEIQNMDLGADLVVLSACETNIGKYQAGEGAMSLARAFKYANCPNIVSTLWKVDDASTKEIITNFYDNLGKGMGKADALAEAKRKFRSDHPKASPYYWAAFVLVGDNEPVHLQKRSNSIIWLSGGVIIIIAAVIARRRKTKMTS